MESLINLIEKYIKENGKATIPEMQVNFNLEFKDIAPTVRELLEEDKITLEGELYYRPVKPKTIEETMRDNRRRLKELRAWLNVECGDNKNDDGEEVDEDDEDIDIGDEDDDDKDEEDDAIPNDYDDIVSRRRALENRRMEYLKWLHESRKAAKQEELGQDEALKDSKSSKCNNTAKETPLKPSGAPLNADNSAQRLVNVLNGINPVAHLTNVISGIANKKDYEQSELCFARKRLTAALHNIAVAQDDKLRFNGKSYSEEYFSAFNKTVSMRKIAEDKYEITADKVYFSDMQPYKVYLIYAGNKTYLSDDGQVYDLLASRIGGFRAKKKLKNHTELKQWLKVEKKALLMPTTIEHSVGDYFRMYYAMYSLVETL